MINEIHKRLLITAYEQFKSAQANLNFVRNVVSNEYGLSEGDTLNIYSDVSVNSSGDIEEGIDKMFRESEGND